VLDTTTPHIEHPRLVAQRLQAYARAIGGMDRIMACTDCGFSTVAGALNLTPDIVYSKIASMVKGAASVADSPSKIVAKFADMVELDVALLDAFMPDHKRTTTLLMGRIVTNPFAEANLGTSYGYSMTYNTMVSGKGNALHRHPSTEIFVPLDAPFEFTYGNFGQHKVTLRAGDAIAVPPGINHTYKNASGDQEGALGRILTVLPGKPSITWAPHVVTQAREMGASCTDSGILLPSDGSRPEGMGLMEAAPTPLIEATAEEGKNWMVLSDSGQTLKFESGDGWLELSWLHMNRGQVAEFDPREDIVAVVICGSVCCGEQLQVLDTVKQPSFFSASQDSMVLLIKSTLPHGMDFTFDPH